MLAPQRKKGLHGRRTRLSQRKRPHHRNEHGSRAGGRCKTDGSVTSPGVFASASRRNGARSAVHAPPGNTAATADQKLGLVSRVDSGPTAATAPVEHFLASAERPPARAEHAATGRAKHASAGFAAHAARNRERIWAE